MANVVALINQSTIVSDAEIASYCPALDAQLNDDFVPFWGYDCGASVIFAAKGMKVPDSARQIIIVDHCNEPGALGFHIDADGNPTSDIGAADDLADGCKLSVTISHELLEMQCDPLCTRMVPVGADQFIVEVSDAVEADADGYEKNGIWVSDFCTPKFFGLSTPSGCTPDPRYDFRGLLTAPCPAMLPGGYLAKLANNQWTDLTARLANGSRSYRSQRSGRTAYRIKAAWGKSLSLYKLER